MSGGHKKIHEHPNAGKYCFKKGKSGNPNGRPKSKRTELRGLIRDLYREYRSNSSAVAPKHKALIFDLYNIAISDYNLKQSNLSVQSSLKSLYFIKSSIGVKVGVSKHPKKRINQIRGYAPDATFLKIIKYAGEFENSIHFKFEDINIKGNNAIGREWFLATQEIMMWINDINGMEDLVLEFGGLRAKKIVTQLSLFDSAPYN